MASPDLTRYRLLNWEGTSGDAERLAGQIVHAEGYEDFDPTHPNGGPDGGKDGFARKGGKLWTVAVWFPNGKKTVRELKRKFADDWNGVARNGADDMVFVTNQRISDSVRSNLRSSVSGEPDIFHLERVAHILGRPEMARVKHDFIDFPESRNPERDEVADNATLEIRDRVSEAIGRSQMVFSDWAPEQLKSQIKRVSRDCPDDFRNLTAFIGDPPTVDLLRKAVEDPPRWLRNADNETWGLMASYAQSLGEWKLASDTWMKKSLRLAGSDAASAIVQAAIAVDMIDDVERRDELFRVAEEADPDNTRLKLQLLDENAEPDAQLAYLAAIPKPEDPEVVGLVASHRALAHIRSGNFDKAEADLAIVQEHLSSSLLTRGLEVTLAVQRGRLALRDGTDFNRYELEQAAQVAAQTRSDLQAQKRWSESTRMLMLMADVHALLGDRGKTSATLRTARAEEKVTTDQKIVLAWCAVGRALDFPLALDLIEGAESTRESDLIRFEAIEDTGSPAERAEALAGLDRLIAEDTAVSTEAAFVRLVATLGYRPTAWSADALEYLKRSGHLREAVIMESLFELRNNGFPAAKSLLAPHLTRTWGKKQMVRLCLSSKYLQKELAPSAQALLEDGPPSRIRVEAGQALARAGQTREARAVLIAICREKSAPEMVRCDAYAHLMNLVGFDQGDWELAFELHQEWIALRPQDPRSHKWGPTTANRKSLRAKIAA